VIIKASLLGTEFLPWARQVNVFQDRPIPQGFQADFRRAANLPIVEDSKPGTHAQLLAHGNPARPEETG
jgi:hypothetical protein